ncbi:MAG: ribonuclease R [Saezia sp.]
MGFIKINHFIYERREKHLKKNYKNKFVSELFEGTVEGQRDGHAFIIRDDGNPDVYIPAHGMQGVLHRDRVKVKIIGLDHKGRPEGKIQEIVSRPKKVLVGRLIQENNVWLVAPEDYHYQQDIIIPKTGLADAKTGQVVTVELTEKPVLYAQPLGRIVEVLGNIDDPGMEIEIAVRKFSIPHVFSDETLRQAAAIPDQVKLAEKDGHIDLTDVDFVTIDGEDARDFDDAVYCEPAQVDGRAGFRLLVAIADVSHYVTQGSALDADAYERATSVYFPRRVIPMLPEKLSNGICSLNPEVERLTLVCDMLITAQGEHYAYQFYPAVIKSCARLTYTEVAAIILNPQGAEAQHRSQCVDDLMNLYGAFLALHSRREQRGALDLDTKETRVICDEAGHVVRIEAYERNDAHRLIEEAMLAANVCAADFILENKCIGLYRVHEGPTPEKAEVLQSNLRSLGLNVVLSDEPTPKEYQHILALTKGREDQEQIQMMLLRSMRQAIYTPENEGHFGLAYEAYTHFTSPIRRYPDLLVHRVIHGILAHKKYVLEDRSSISNLATLDKKRKHDEPLKDKQDNQKAKQSKEMQAWQVAGQHCSANERRADEASRDVLAWLKCVYMREHLGETFVGTVTSVTSFGLFVQLDELYVEGLVHISELEGYYQFDEVRRELVCEHTGVHYTLGSQLRVLVSRVDLDSRQIDFRPVLSAGAKSSSRRGSANRTSAKKPLALKSTRKVEELKKATKRAVQKAVKAVKKNGFKFIEEKQCSKT